VSPLKPGPRVRGGIVLIFDEVDVPHLPRSQQGVDVATESRVAWCRCQAARSSSLTPARCESEQLPCVLVIGMRWESRRLGAVGGHKVK
jgi:hypothetical protein